MMQVYTASSSTRRLNSSHESSRLMNRSGEDNSGEASASSKINSVVTAGKSFFARRRATQVSAHHNGHDSGNKFLPAPSRIAGAMAPGYLFQRLGVDPVLLDQHPRRQPFSIVAGKNGDARNGNDRARVEFGGDMVDRATVHGAPLGEGALMRVQTAQVGQQRRMDIEQPARPSFDEACAQDAHKSRKADEFDLRRPKAPVKLRLEIGLSRKVPEVDRLRDDARFARGLQPGRLRPVGQHECDLSREVGPARRRNQRLHVRAAAGNEDSVRTRSVITRADLP